MEHSVFTLHKTLAADTCTVLDLPLCMLLLSNDANYPWTILVPRRASITEIYKLNAVDQQQLLAESNALSECLQSLLNPDKLNVAALGNRVPQLHLHHIARYKTDSAWPAPVWGHSEPTPYDPDSRDLLVERIRAWFDRHTKMLQTPAADAQKATTSETSEDNSGYELAQLNIATQQYPLEAPEMGDFVANLDRINRLAEQSPGFVWRLQTEDGDATAIRHFGDNVVVNMSTWTDIDSLHDYVYKTAHIDVLKRRREWFTTMRYYSVLWWVKSGTRPSIEEAAQRLQLLEQHGPHEDAFTFKRSWPQPASQA